MFFCLSQNVDGLMMCSGYAPKLAISNRIDPFSIVPADSLLYKIAYVKENLQILQRFFHLSFLSENSVNPAEPMPL